MDLRAKTSQNKNCSLYRRVGLIYYFGTCAWIEEVYDEILDWKKRAKGGCEGESEEVGWINGWMDERKTNEASG